MTIFDGMTSSPPSARRMTEWALAPVRPAVETGGAEEVALAAMRERHLAVEDLVFAHHAEAAAERAGAAGILPQRDAVDADRRLHLHRFGRQVHAVRGVGLDDVDAVQAGAGAAAAGDQLADDVAAAVRLLPPKAMTSSSPADAAGTRSGRTWASAPIMQPVMRLMVEVRALTARGFLRIDDACPWAGAA